MENIVIYILKLDCHVSWSRVIANNSSTLKEYKSDVFLLYLSGSGCFSGSQ